MGEDFVHFSIDPEIQRYAQQARALRAKAVTDVCHSLARSVRGVGAALISASALWRKVVG